VVAPETSQQYQQQEDPQTRFRRLAESAAIVVTDSVMKRVVFHFSSQMTVVNTADQAADLYKRASWIPRSTTEVRLREKNISVANIMGGTDTAKSIVLEAFDGGKPCLLKITHKESIEHELIVWEAIKRSGGGGQKNNLVPLRKLEFQQSAKVQVGNLSGGYNDVDNYSTGILMRKYQSTLRCCKIPLTEDVLLRYGEQLKTAISVLHECGYCHMDIKPSNIFLWEEECLLGDYGGATKIGEKVREHTLMYYLCDAGRDARKETDFLLLTVTLLEMFGSVASPPGAMTTEEIRSKVAGVENKNVKALLSRLVSF
jgi:serine/threonine protein kinase